MAESSHNLRLKRQLQHIQDKKAEPASRQINWEGLWKQIEAGWNSLSTLDNDTPEKLAQLWRQRAAHLAQIPTPEAVGEQLPLIVVRLGRERYGLEVKYVRDVVQARSLTRVPRVPAWVAGIVTQRGNIISVIDLQQFLGMEAAPQSAEGELIESYLVNVHTAEMEVALRVDEVLGLEVIPLEQLRPLESAPQGFRAELVRGALQHTAPQAADLLMVLNIPALLSDQRLIVNEPL